MSSKPVVFDDDNPEWSEEDFAEARPLAAFPALHAALSKSKGGRPRGSEKEQIALRIDKAVLIEFRAGGPGWQTRMNEHLRGALTGSALAAVRGQAVGARTTSLAA